MRGVDVDELEQRVTRVTVAPIGKPIFSDRAFRVEIDDEAGGEFVIICANTDNGRDVAIDPSDWPMLRAAIDQMIGECRT